MLAELATLVRARGEQAWLVGGAVRDRLLGRPIADLDVVVSGDAGDVADALAALLGGSVRRHARFGTATLELPAEARGGREAVRVDLARPRRETYAHAGALPDVSFAATLEEDLARRDFTIHSMALPLAGPARRIDPFGGAEDLAAKRIRILHERSFQDDPTRAFRAVRYAARLGFGIVPASARLIREAVASGAVGAVSGDRLLRELSLILAEPARVASAALLARLGLDGAIAPGLARRGVGARLRAAASAAGRLGLGVGIVALDPLCYLLAWMGDASPRELREVADRLGLAGRVRETWLGWPATRARGAGFARAGAGERARRVRGIRPELAAAVAATLSPRDRAAWIAAVREPLPGLLIRGRDLLAAGVPPGPRVGEALARTLEAREEGRIDAEEELEFALAAAREGLRS
ncbi:MAG TPA: hypothetical protein VH854_03900 [Thermoanaerobaculia bacterium]|nr:hypothetical protein [Thermoanaerobaculia bacterium]